MQKSTYLDPTKLQKKFVGNVTTQHRLNNSGSWQSASCLGTIPTLYLKASPSLQGITSINVHFPIFNSLYEICPDLRLYIDEFLQDIRDENLMELVNNFQFSPNAIQFDYSSRDLLGHYKAVFFASLMRCITWYPYIILNYKWLKDKEVTPHFFNRLQLAQVTLNKDLKKEQDLIKLTYATIKNFDPSYDGGHLLFDRGTIYLLSSEMKMPKIIGKQPPKGFFARDYNFRLSPEVVTLLTKGCTVSDYKFLLENAGKGVK